METLGRDAAGKVCFREFWAYAVEQKLCQAFASRYLQWFTILLYRHATLDHTYQEFHSQHHHCWSHAFHLQLFYQLDQHITDRYQINKVLPDHQQEAQLRQALLHDQSWKWERLQRTQIFVSTFICIACSLFLSKCSRVPISASIILSSISVHSYMWTAESSFVIAKQQYPTAMEIDSPARPGTETIPENGLEDKTVRIETHLPAFHRLFERISEPNHLV